jgi:hypothetical protein
MAKSEPRAEPKPAGGAGQDASADAPGVIVWCRRDQARFLEAVCERLGLVVDRVGFPGASGATTPAEASGPTPFPEAARVTDLRHAVASGPARAVLVAHAWADEGSGLSLLDDPSFVKLARERGTPIIASEPTPGALEHLSAIEGAERDERTRLLPVLAEARLFGDVKELLPHLGALRTAVFTARSAPVHGTLGARLFDAMATLGAILGMPDRIDCAVTAPAMAGAAGGAGASVGLRRLDGHATAHLRYPGGHSAAVAVSNQAGPWFRGLTLLGDAATLRLSDGALELLSPTGEPIERSGSGDAAGADSAAAGDSKPSGGMRADGAKAGASAGKRGPARGKRLEPNLFTAAARDVAADLAAGQRDDPAIGVFAEELRRALDPGIGPAVRVPRSEALAMCETALLSSRTGNPEHTHTLLNITGARQR